MPPSVSAVAVVVDDPPDPPPPHRDVGAVRQDRRVLDRDGLLVAEPVRHPAADLRGRELPRVHAHVERVRRVVALGLRAQAFDEVAVRRPDPVGLRPVQRLGHASTSSPSYPISTPAFPTIAPSGASGSRIGLELLMCTSTVRPTPSSARKSSDRSSATWPHVGGGLAAQALPDQLVVVEGGAVDEQGVGARARLAQRLQVGDPRGVHDDAAGAPVVEAVPDDAALLRAPDVEARRLPGGQVDRGVGEVVGQRVLHPDPHPDHRHRAVRLERRQEARAVAQHGLGRGGGVHGHPGTLAQDQQAERVVDLGVGEQDRLDRRAAAVARVQVGARRELLADVGRGVDEEPALAVGRHRDRRLGARGRPAGAGGAAAVAGAVPLREAAAGGGPEDADAHVSSPGPGVDGSGRSA